MKKDRLKFEMVNNLVIIPVELNGTPLSFLLDTGVSSTLLFSVEEKDSVQINSAKPLRIKGLGKGDAIDALVSGNNRLKVGRAVDLNHVVYVVLDKKLNFSTRMGVPIHGILGYDFFKDFVVKTDYTSQWITVYEKDYYKNKKCKRCAEFDLLFHNRKPYINVAVTAHGNTRDLTLLLDSGSSDALWLFNPEDYITEEPKNYFEDFLGLGLSGDIFGMRSKTEKLTIGKYTLNKVSTAFPHPEALENVQLFEERDGSLGSEILKRFTVILDYGNKKMHLRQNSNFGNPFYYNMSGLTIEHDGLIPIMALARLESSSFNLDSGRASTIGRNPDIVINQRYNFFLAPKFIVAEISPGSPADLAGIKKGDEIIKVNGRSAYRYKLYQLVELFSSKPGRKIYIDINRNGYEFRARFTLKKVI